MLCLDARRNSHPFMIQELPVTPSSSRLNSWSGQLISESAVDFGGPDTQFQCDNSGWENTGTISYKVDI